MFELKVSDAKLLRDMYSVMIAVNLFRILGVWLGTWMPFSCNCISQPRCGSAIRSVLVFDVFTMAAGFGNSNLNIRV